MKRVWVWAEAKKDGKLVFMLAVVAVGLMMGCVSAKRHRIELARTEGVAYKNCNERVKAEVKAAGEWAEDRGWNNGKDQMKDHYENVVSKSSTSEVISWLAEIRRQKKQETGNRYWADLVAEARKMMKPAKIKK